MRELNLILQNIQSGEQVYINVIEFLISGSLVQFHPAEKY